MLSIDVGAVKAILPKVPLIGKTALFHTLGFSEQSKHWDLRSELIINVLRSFLHDTPLPILKIQKLSMGAPEVKGRLWISRVTMPVPPEDSLRQTLFSAIEALKEPGEPKGGFTEPEMVPVEAEWTGYRAGATTDSVELRISEAEKYKEMMREVSSSATVLYFHGGAYYLMDPVTHRPTTKKLARITKGRCFSVRYRLAPQNPFPAALLDALVSYFTLLYPPAGSFHEPVEAKNIVFAGDSAGGNLCLVLLQTLLQFRRQGAKVTWNGQEREVPLPAGVATCSAWADITHSSPSCEMNKKYDYLPPVSANPDGYSFPSDEAWPTNPPRNNLYAEDAMVCHPLVSPLSAKSWEGSCPLWIETGEEILTDESKFVATKAARQGVKVVYEEYGSMPHCFAMLLETIPASRLFFDRWAMFITDVVERPEELKAGGKRIVAKSLREDVLNLETMCAFSEEEVKGRMKERAGKLSQRRPDMLAKL